LTQRDNVLKAFRAAGNPKRYTILAILARHDEGLTYTELAELSGFNPQFHPSKFNYHVKNLMNAGLVAKRSNKYFLSKLGLRFYMWILGLTRLTRWEWEDEKKEISESKKKFPLPAWRL